MPRLLALLVVACSVAAADARPAYRRALVDLLELPAASRINDCRVCHLPGGKDESDRPHNAFGKRLAALRGELREAGKPDDITARLLASADEDSDNDGVPNLVELLAGTFPGDPTDKPSAAQVVAARVRQAELIASLKNYRWRPFDRVERPAIPPANAGARNPIDGFIAAEHGRLGLTPRPEASRETLLRRVSIDLTGLAPTTEEMATFRADTRPGAYERLVDRLLESPRYGERWGRHFMDVWRYSDWAGFGAQVRDSQPFVRHWRVWIVESLNADKPYDRMVHEMLAADELAPTDAAALRATGYLVRNYKLLSREKWLQDAVDHTSMAFMGLTLGCARCHDHMFDPLTQKEYFQVRAVFAPHNVRTDRLPGRLLTLDGLPRAFDADPKAMTHLLLRGDDRTPDKKPLAPGVPESLGGKFSPAEVALPRGAYQPERRAFVLAELIALAEKAVELHDKGIAGSRLAETLAPLSAALMTPTLGSLTVVGLRSRLREGDEMAREAAVEVVKKYRLLAVVEQMEDNGQNGSPKWQQSATALVASQRRFAYLTARNRAFTLRHCPEAGLGPMPTLPQRLIDAGKALAIAEAAEKAIPSTKYTPRAITSYPATSTGRRLAFARWITHRDNPLAARVAVNHVWIRHFGRGLVPSAFDFGRNGQPPTHAALLDWLAVEFMERGWGSKDLHRLILTSATYRQASTPHPGNLERDPDNVYLWRFAPRRVEAEVVRDAIFHVADRLDSTMGGPEIPYTQGLLVPRRSLYFQQAAEKQMELLEIFDGANVVECYQRRQAIMPQQSLALLNSDLVLRHARLTARALHDGRRDEAFVTAAFERLLSRGPTAEEIATCGEFLVAQSAKYAAMKPKMMPPDATGALPATEPGLRARERLVHVLMNHHEFVTIR